MKFTHIPMKNIYTIMLSSWISGLQMDVSYSIFEVDTNFKKQNVARTISFQMK